MKPGVYWPSRVVFSASLGTLVLGAIFGSISLCAAAWLLLWLAAIIQDRKVRS